MRLTDEVTIIKDMDSYPVGAPREHLFLYPKEIEDLGLRLLKMGFNLEKDKAEVTFVRDGKSYSVPYGTIKDDVRLQSYSLEGSDISVYVKAFCDMHSSNAGRGEKVIGGMIRETNGIKARIMLDNHSMEEMEAIKKEINQMYHFDFGKDVLKMLKKHLPKNKK